MGLFTYIGGGTGNCLKCGKASSICFQTKLFYTDAENSCIEYRAGDTVLIDGLEDCLPIHERIESESLVIVFADWSCEHCHLSYQCTKVVFDPIHKTKGDLIAKIVSVEQFLPIKSTSFDKIHFVEDELALLLDSMDKNQSLGQFPVDKYAAFLRLTVEEKVKRILKGQRLWAEYHNLEIADKIQMA